MNVGNLISDSSAFSKSSLNIWKFTVHVLLKPGLENFELYFASMWDECSCAVVWAFFGIAFLWNWNKNWPFPVLWSLLSFPNLLDHLKSKSSRTTSTSELLTMPKPLTMWITTNWKILKEMKISDCLTCLLRNLYAGQEVTVRTRHGPMYWFKIGKGVC